VDDEAAKWEAILAGEGMPAELRMLSQSHGGDGHNDGLVCVSMTLSQKSRIKGEGMIQGGKHSSHRGEGDWYMRNNMAFFGRETAMQDTETAAYWQRFSGRIWDSGVSGERLAFLLDYAEHGYISRSCRKFGWDRRLAYKLIEFVLTCPKKDEEPCSGCQ
jgi:hypothetical protein